MRTRPPADLPPVQRDELNERAVAALFMARVSPFLDLDERIEAEADGWRQFHGHPHVIVPTDLREHAGLPMLKHIERQALSGSPLHLRILAILYVHGKDYWGWGPGRQCFSIFDNLETPS